MIFNRRNADRVRFLLTLSPGLDNDMPVGFAGVDVVLVLLAAAVNLSAVTSRIVLKKSRAATRRVLSIIVICFRNDKRLRVLTLPRRRALLLALDHFGRRDGGIAVDETAFGVL